MLKLTEHFIYNMRHFNEGNKVVILVQRRVRVRVQHLIQAQII